MIIDKRLYDLRNKAINLDIEATLLEEAAAEFPDIVIEELSYPYSGFRYKSVSANSKVTHFEIASKYGSYSCYPYLLFKNELRIYSDKSYFFKSDYDHESVKMYPSVLEAMRVDGISQPVIDRLAAIINKFLDDKAKDQEIQDQLDEFEAKLRSDS